MLASPNRVRRWLFGRDVSVWHDPAYRLPLPSLEGRTGFDARRPDSALWYLLESGAIAREQVRRPRRVDYAELSRVHTPGLLESLGNAATLARIYSVDESDVVVDEVMRSVRLACGATLEAARELARPAAASVGRRALNLSGGFHHAGPGSAGGFCPINDVAVAIASLRAGGFAGRVAVLDLDAHPPDGTAACLRGDPACFVGSLSGVHWEVLSGVDETVLPEGCGDAEYLRALDALLARMPPSALAFVIASGDVLRNDPLGKLGLTVEGCRARDLAVADALSRTPSVWLPGGGYSADAWRVLAGTGLALSIRSRAAIPAGYDPVQARFSSIARSLSADELHPGGDEDELAQDLGLSRPGRRLLAGVYSAEGLEHVLSRYGVLEQLARLGYGPFRVSLEEPGVGQSVRVTDVPSGQALIEVVLEKRRVAEADVLYVHWLALRHPRGRFRSDRAPLPGQEVPGLGLAREVVQLLLRMAERLGLEGLAFRPAAFHLAWRGREMLRFVDPARQGRFEALVRDLGPMPLAEATRRLAEGGVLREGRPYEWEPEEMVQWLRPRDHDREAIAAERERVHFSLAPPA